MLWHVRRNDLGGLALNRNRWLTIGGAVLVVAVFGWWWASTHRGSEKPRYRTAALEKGDIEMVVSATGTVRPVEQVEVGSQVSGTVSRITADFNSRVSRGQLLLQLDPASFRARYQQAEASVARAQAAVRDAERNYARAKELIQQNYISQTEVEAAEVRVDQAKADLKQARAQMASAAVDLQNSSIRSPIDGVVISRSVEVGQTVAASLQAPKLFVIANDLSRMQVETRIDEADIGQIRPGLPVTFTVDAFPDQNFEGQVSEVRLEPITEQNVVTYTTVIATRNPDLKLRPGMTANVSVEVARRGDVLRLPNAALRFHPPADASGGRRAVAVAAQSRNAARAGGAGAGVGAGVGAGAGAGAGLRRGARSGADTASMRGRRGGTSSAASQTTAEGDVIMGTTTPRPKPGTVYVLRGGKPTPVQVTTGISDGGFTEVIAGELAPGDEVIVGSENGGNARTGTAGTQLPPGMGGFGGGGGGRGGRGGR
jgi:HlyD family secretion protein